MFSSLPLLPASLLKNLSRSGSLCRDGCWGKEGRARWEQPDKPLCSLCQGNGRTSIISHTGESLHPIPADSNAAQREACLPGCTVGN